MGVLFFRLSQVPEDEAQDVREFLAEAEIEFYETHAGNWGISLAAIWLVNETELPRAKQLMDDYQRQRSESCEAESQQAPPETVLQRWRREPLKIFLCICAVAAIIYISIMPLLSAWT